MQIDLDGCHITEDSLKRLCISCPSLEEVKLPRRDDFSEACLRVLLQHLPALRTLKLKGRSSVTGRCFSLLPESLQQLSVVSCDGFRSESLRQVGARCPQLRELTIFGLKKLRAGELAAVLTGCPQLERLKACDLSVPLERCLPPAGLPALRHLDIGWGRGVTDTTLRQLPDRVPGLQILSIEGTSYVYS